MWVDEINDRVNAIERFAVNAINDIDDIEDRLERVVEMMGDLKIENNRRLDRSIDKAVSGMDGRIDMVVGKVNHSLVGLNRRLNMIDRGIEIGVAKDVSVMAERIDKIDDRIDKIERAIRVDGRDIGNIIKRFDGIDKAVSGMDDRIDKIEQNSIKLIDDKIGVGASR